MSFLLDTHVVLWASAEPDRLRPASRKLIEGKGRELWLSRVSIWELAIKVSLKKVRLPVPLQAYVTQMIEDLALLLLPIESEHLYRVGGLPFHHRDPFDRLLVAQALHEGLTIVSRDRVFDRYGLRRIF